MRDYPAETGPSVQLNLLQHTLLQENKHASPLLPEKFSVSPAIGTEQRANTIFTTPGSCL